MIGRLAPLVAAVSLSIGCGGGGTTAATPTSPTADPTAAPTSAPSAEAKGGEDKASDALPTECEAKKEGLCAPPAKFVKRLCAGFFPDIALALFRKGTPWTRGYLNRNVEAWNASGGAASSDKLEFDEEVLVLAHHAADTGGMQVSGTSGGYDVLRWDGTCASLMGEELTLKVPPKAKNAKIPWKNLDDKVRDALLSDEKVAKVSSERKKECKGATMGDVSLKCVKADTMLTVVVVDYIRNGGDVPIVKLP
jgi:hypothetical protein